MGDAIRCRQESLGDAGGREMVQDINYMPGPFSGSYTVPESSGSI